MKFDINNGGMCGVFCDRCGLFFYFIAAFFIAAFFLINNVKAFTGTEWAFSYTYQCNNGGTTWAVSDDITYIYFFIDNAPPRLVANDTNGISYVDASLSCSGVDNVLVVNYKDQTISAYINGTLIGAPMTNLVFDDLNFVIDDSDHSLLNWRNYTVYNNILTANEMYALNYSTLINDQNIGKIYEYDKTGTILKIYDVPFLLWGLIGSVILEIFLVFFIFKYYAVK
jgi:hypothetical protein